MTIPILFLCVGAQKSGTTWLYEQLEDHDAINCAKYKELHYFDTLHIDSMIGPIRKAREMRALLNKNFNAVKDYTKLAAQGKQLPQEIHNAFGPMDDRWYESLFHNTGIYHIDFSPEYALLNDAGHEHIKSISLQQKIIFVMREPVKRALSAVRYFFQMNNMDITNAAVDDILQVARYPFIRQMSNYTFTIEMLEKHYKKDQLKFLLYEEMMEDKQKHLAAICRWLAISELENNPIDVEKSINKTTSTFVMPDEVTNFLKDALTDQREYIFDRFPESKNYW